MTIKNNDIRQIMLSEMAPHVHSFLPNENKVEKISNWLTNWITSSLKSGKIMPNDFLPTKGDLAFHIGVSLGTMQNVFRILEDKGLIESKQRIGSYIKNPKDNPTIKLTSKREIAAEAVKRHLKEGNYKLGDKLISTRKLSSILAIPFATIRIGINLLISEGILIKKDKSFFIKSLNFDLSYKESQTLVEKIAESINLYIKDNLKSGDKLPSNGTLADMFKVSVKTIHDAIKILSLAQIVKTRRGYYGTVVLGDKQEQDEKYFYEQVELYIKKYIAENCKVGTKLPTIKNFSEVFNVSAKTIKNALDNLAYDGFVTFVRGRFGGTFVTEIPTVYDKGYTWLALSSEFEQIN